VKIDQYFVKLRVKYGDTIFRARCMIFATFDDDDNDDNDIDIIIGVINVNICMTQ